MVLVISGTVARWESDRPPCRSFPTTSPSRAVRIGLESSAISGTLPAPSHSRARRRVRVGPQPDRRNLRAHPACVCIHAIIGDERQIPASNCSSACASKSQARRAASATALCAQASSRLPSDTRSAHFARGSRVIIVGSVGAAISQPSGPSARLRDATCTGFPARFASAIIWRSSCSSGRRSRNRTSGPEYVCCRHMSAKRVEGRRGRTSGVGRVLEFDVAVAVGCCANAPRRLIGGGFGIAFDDAGDLARVEQPDYAFQRRFGHDPVPHS